MRSTNPEGPSRDRDPSRGAAAAGPGGPHPEVRADRRRGGARPRRRRLRRRRDAVPRPAGARRVVLLRDREAPDVRAVRVPRAVLRRRAGLAHGRRPLPGAVAAQVDGGRPPRPPRDLAGPAGDRARRHAEPVRRRGRGPRPGAQLRLRAARARPRSRRVGGASTSRGGGRRGRGCRTARAASRTSASPTWPSWAGTRRSSTSSSPVVRGEVGCSEQPQRAVSMALASIVELGDVETAAASHRSAYRASRRNPGETAAVARHLEVLARTGNVSRGLDVLAEQLDALDRPSSPMTGMQLAAAADPAAAPVVDAGDGDRLVRGRGREPERAVDLLARVEAQALTTARRFDERNGTTAVGDRVRDWIAAPDLPALPLGTTHPDRTTAPQLDLPRVPAHPALQEDVDLAALDVPALADLCRARAARRVPPDLGPAGHALARAARDGDRRRAGARRPRRVLRVELDRPGAGAHAQRCPALPAARRRGRGGARRAPGRPARRAPDRDGDRAQGGGRHRDGQPARPGPLPAGRGRPGRARRPAARRGPRPAGHAR